MNTMPLIEGGMTDLVRAMHVVQTFIAQTREVVGQAIKGDVFPNELVEVRASFVVVVVVVVVASLSSVVEIGDMTRL